MQRTLVLLTLNEIEAIRKIFDRLPLDVAGEVLVIDGKSTDGTIEFLRQRGLKVIIQDRPGRGAAMQIAAEKATGQYLVYFSLDGNEDPNDIDKLFKRLEAGADLVIASRMMRGAFNEEDVSWFRPRKFVNKTFTLAANLIWNRGRYITDTINGFRGITTKAFKRLKINADDFTIEYQMSIRAMKMKYKVEEIPTHEGERLGGHSKAKSLPTGIAFIKRLITEI